MRVEQEGEEKMKYAVAGMMGLGILLLAGVTIQTVQTKAVRQNELDTALSNAMRRSMETVSTNPVYPIQSEEELKADVVEYFSESLKGNGKGKISYTLHILAKQFWGSRSGTRNFECKSRTNLCTGDRKRESFGRENCDPGRISEEKRRIFYRLFSG